MAKLHTVVVMKGGLFPNSHRHIAAFPVRPPYVSARYRGLRLSPRYGVPHAATTP